MPPSSDRFVAHCLDLLAPIGAAHSRRMFGGHGLYIDDLFVAIVAFEQLYLKVDADSKPHFEAEGCAPFVYQASGRNVSLGYFSAPAQAIESPALMQPWARLALAAAVRARAAKPASAARKPPASARAKRASADQPPAKTRRRTSTR
jgi:DNA transformation protein